MKIYGRGAELFPKSYLTCHGKSQGPIEPLSIGPAIDGQPMSFVRLGSRAASIHLLNDRHFKIGNRTYERLRDGSLRVHGKEPSRVKRMREQRRTV
jgi:hypothetical protein